MAVNLTERAGRARAAALLESSFAQFQADRGVVGLARRLRRVRATLDELAESMTCDRGDFMEYAQLRRQLTEAERGASRGRASAQRAAALRALGALRRGDIIRIPSGRRAGMAVVLAPPPASDVSAPARVDGPLVLTASGQLKQLSAADFPVPAEPVERLRVPALVQRSVPEAPPRSRLLHAQQARCPRLRRPRPGRPRPEWSQPPGGSARQHGRRRT